MGKRTQRSEAIRVSKSFYPWSFLVRWFYCVLLTLQGDSVGVLEKYATFKHLGVLCFCSRGSKAILVALAFRFSYFTWTLSSHLSLFTQSGKGSIFCFLLVPKNPLKIINSCPLSSACDTEEIEHRA